MINILNEILYDMTSEILSAPTLEKIRNELIKSGISSISITLLYDRLSHAEFQNVLVEQLREEFNMQTLDFGNMFCNKCLYDFVPSFILSEDVDNTHCLNYDYTKEISKAEDIKLTWLAM